MIIKTIDKNHYSEFSDYMSVSKANIGAIIAFLLSISMLSPAILSVNADIYTPRITFSLYNISNMEKIVLSQNIPLDFWPDALALSEEYVAWFEKDGGKIIGVMNLTTFTKEELTLPIFNIMGLGIYGHNLILINLTSISLYNLKSKVFHDLVSQQKDIVVNSVELNNDYLIYREYFSKKIKVLYLNNMSTYDLGKGEAAKLNQDRVLFESFSNESNNLRTLKEYNLSSKTLKTIKQKSTSLVPLVFSNDFFVWREDGDLIINNRESNESQLLFKTTEKISELSANDWSFVYTEIGTSKKQADVFLYNMSTNKTHQLTNTKNVHEYKAIINKHYIAWAAYEVQEESTASLSILQFFVAVAASVTFIKFGRKFQHN